MTIFDCMWVAVGQADSWVKNYDKRNLVPFPACASFTNEHCSGSFSRFLHLLLSRLQRGTPAVELLSACLESLFCCLSPLQL